MKELTSKTIAKMIDHSFLNPTLTQAELADGGKELDMVVNISKVLSADWSYVRDEIKAVIEITHAAGQKVKVIFENCYLEDDHKIRLCQICGELNADWVKTSTGYGTGGATIEDLKLMRANSPAHIQIKAAGGVRDLDKLLEVRALGVTRSGATRTKETLDVIQRTILNLPQTSVKTYWKYSDPMMKDKLKALSTTSPR